MAFISKVDSNLNLPNVNNKSKSTTGEDFSALLKKELDQTNDMMKKAEDMEVGIATGQVQDLAKATITIQKAEMEMKMMLEVRNKAINAYKELLKTQI
jgi:flagellar hook-basal body complex protein FliE